MKVLHVIPSVGPFRGGPSEILKTFVDGLAREGVEVHVCTTDDNGPGRLKPGFSRPVKAQGVTYWYFPRQLGFYTVSLPLAKWLAAHIADYDLVHIHALFSFSSNIAALIAKQQRVPYIIRPLGVLNEWGMRNRRPWLKKMSLNLIELKLLRSAALVHYTSEAERQQAALAGVDGPSLVLPNPIQPVPLSDLSDTFRQSYPELAGKKILLFLSRIDPKKGLEILLEAFAVLRPAEAGFYLLIAGTGDAAYVNALKMRAESLGIAPHILWAGLVSGESKAAFFAGADLFVLPSHSENFGNAVAEALAAALPVVISENVGIHDEVKRAGAGLVVRCEAAAVAAAIEQFFSTTGLAARMSRSAMNLATDAFSSKTVIRRLKACYDDLLQTPVHGSACTARIAC